MKDDRYYEGEWAGRSVKLDRAYRGRVLTIRECAALFRGRSIELHGLRRGRTVYSIECRLEQDPVLQDVVNVKSMGTVPFNPDYRLDRETSPFKPHGLKEEALDAGGMDGGLLDMQTKEAILEDAGDDPPPGRTMYVTGPSRSGNEERLRALGARFAGSWRAALGLA